jgi:hypothetical protein
MAKRNRVIDRDRGWRKKRANAESVKGAHVKVGVIAALGEKPKEERGPSDIPQKADVTVAEVAFWNEFGTKRVPARSFIRSTHDESRQKIARMKARLAKLIIDGKMDVKRALGILGEWMKARQIRKIDRLRTPPNEPSTIRQKKSSNPLVDLGQLKQSIDYEIVLRAGAKVTT